jgi:uncharacterized protein (DUF983 family)
MFSPHVLMFPTLYVAGPGLDYLVNSWSLQRPFSDPIWSLSGCHMVPTRALLGPFLVGLISTCSLCSLFVSLNVVPTSSLCVLHASYMVPTQSCADWSVYQVGTWSLHRLCVVRFIPTWSLWWPLQYFVPKVVLSCSLHVLHAAYMVSSIGQ